MRGPARSSEKEAAERPSASLRQGQREGAGELAWLHSTAGNGAVARLLEPIRSELRQPGEELVPGVRFHRGPGAARAAEAANATAFTVGRDVVLGARVPPLSSSEGRRVLAHELVHVLQQSGAPQLSLGLVPPGSRAEQQAAAGAAGPGAESGLARIEEKDLTQLDPTQLEAEYNLALQWVADHPSGAEHEAGARYLDAIEQAMTSWGVTASTTPVPAATTSGEPAATSPESSSFETTTREEKPEREPPKGPAHEGQRAPELQQREGVPDKQRVLELLKDPDVAKRVAKALKKGRDLSGVLNEELMNVEIASRLSTGRGLEDILPKGRTPENVTFVPGHEIWTAGGQSFSDGLLLDAAQFDRALKAADAQAAAAKGRARRRPTAPSELVVDARAFFEAKAGETGARKLAAKGEDVTKMKPEEVKAARAEHSKVVQESAQEAAAKGEPPGAVIKTDIGGQVGEVYERAMVEGHLDVIVKGRGMRLRFSRHTTAILAVPADVDLKSELALLRRVSRDVRKLDVPTTQKALKDVAEQIEVTSKPPAEAPPSLAAPQMASAKPTAQSPPETTAAVPAELTKTAAMSNQQSPPETTATAVAETAKPPTKPPPPGESGLRPDAQAIELPGIGDAKVGWEGAAMMLHGRQERQLEGYEREKEAAEFERIRPFIQRALDAGKWVHVDSIWLKTRDPIGDVSGFHEAGTLPVFKRLEVYTGSSAQEALHPPRVQSMGPAPPESALRPLEPSELEGHPERYLDQQPYATFEPTTLAEPKTFQPSARRRSLGPDAWLDPGSWKTKSSEHPDPKQLAGQYGGVADPPYAFLLKPAGDGLRIRWARSTDTWDDFYVAAQHWMWNGPMGVLQSTLVDPGNLMRIKSTLMILGGPFGEITSESYTVFWPDGRTDSGQRTPRKRATISGDE